MNFPFFGLRQKIVISSSVKNKNFKEYSFEDIKII